MPALVGMGRRGVAVAAIVTVAGAFATAGVSAPVAAADPTPAITVTPSTSLPQSTSVDVAGTGWTPGATVVISECETSAPTLCNPQDASAVAQPDGSITANLTVTRLLHLTATQGGVNCAAAAGTCEIFAYVSGGANSATFTLEFDPNAPLTRPTVTVTPSTGLYDGLSVTVAGDGFGAAGSVYVIECAVGALAVGNCDLNTLVTPAVTAGSFSTAFTVRSASANGADCTTAGHCEIIATDVNDTANSNAVPIVVGPALPALSVVSAVSVQPGSGSATADVPVSLAAASASEVTVGWSTADGSAVAGTDYTASSGTADFAPGSTSATVSVPVSGAALGSADKTFSVTLSSPANAVVDPSHASTTVTLVPAAWSSTFGVDSVVGALLQRGQDVYGIPIPDGIGAVTDLAAGAYTPGGEFTPSPWPYPVPTDGPTVLSLDWTAARTTELTNLSNYFQLTPEQTEVLIASLAAFFVALLPPPQPT